MNYFFDTEFNEVGTGLDLISIAIISEDGREYFAVNSGFDAYAARSNAWLAEHVMPHLPTQFLSNGASPIFNPVWKPRWEIAQDIVNFVSDGLNTPPVFWADYASYDWLALCGLYGKIPNLPAGWPKFPMDIQNLKAFVGFKGDLPKPPCQHDGLLNVRNAITRYYFLYEYRRNFNLTSDYQG